MKTTILIGITALATALPALAADNAAVLANYNKHCVSCHAKDGSGNTTMGKKVGTKDYRDEKVVKEIKDEEALKQIKEGMKDKAGKELMKPFAGKLSDAEIKDLLEYVKSFAKK